MNKITTINRLRYDNINVYDGGEAIIVSQNNGNSYVSEIGKQYFFGNMKLYKSNYFDVNYDDSGVSRQREESVNDFIKTNVKLFSPAFMEIRNINPLNNIILESNSTEGIKDGK
jgi:hypothetical protein